MKQQELQKSKEYKYGFTTDIESVRAPKGLNEEVIRFNKVKIKKNHSAKKVIGIEEITKYLDNQIKLEQAKELIAIKTRQYAKRQATWAKSRMITWTKIDPRKFSSVIKKINKSSLKLDQLI